MQQRAECKKFLKEHCFYDMDKIDEDWSNIKHFYSFDVTCQGSVPEAVNCALRHISTPAEDTYETVVREAVSLGGDADTQAAMAGGIASVECPIPDHILSECLDRLDPPLADVIDRFNEYCNK